MLLTPVRRAHACGPDFPPELLSDRLGTLAELPDGLFMLEVSRLLPKPADTFLVVESYPEPEGARTGGGARETALYEAGAKAFHAGDWEEARARFLEVLTLPAEERRRFSTFAAFMLGRTAHSAPEARLHFSQVRELVRQGFEDPLGLAVASLGEEARVLLNEGDDTGAIRLYAEQAAHRSVSGQASLLFVARKLALDETRLRKALRDPLAQRLLTTYAWTRAKETVWVDGEAQSSPMPRLLEALAAVPGLAGADRLAASAWQAGRFDLAERFAGQEKTALDAWVRAKLALRRGDRPLAEQCLAEAAQGYPEAEDWSRKELDEHPQRPRARVEGERTLLALAQGDFQQAAEHALASCSWEDLAYIAERVLTVEELQRFLADHASDPAGRCAPELSSLLKYETHDKTDEDPNARLRVLLGRRLLRSGRGHEAQAFFRGTRWEEPARKYVEALDQAQSAWSDVDEAQALYSAARLARTQGLELLGTELTPDWGYMKGFFDPGTWRPEMRQHIEVTPARIALKDVPVTTEAEKDRCSAHAPPHPLRFHYRSTAADLAEKAAELVPPRSQAYAALLCHAARFVSRTDPERVQRLWRTYVKRGAFVPEVSQFGQSCPEPDFERLRNQKLTLRWPARRLSTLAMVGGGMLLPVAGAFFFVRRRRRETKSQGSGK
ncbi:hypothetical protein [Archangium violaceum]|uniref:hypothetical protein n=1 Tax=Archangium violaceum TaxID=83451 RepID=UPI001EEF78CB|nr:hypothetical protein [Archangium violaceum]